MKAIHIDTANSYEVHIGRGLIDCAGEHIAKHCDTGRVAIISDSNVFPVYGSRLTSSLEKAGYTVSSIVFPAGEKSKNQNTLFHILNMLAKQEFTRSDFLIALGGGVVGDITGFAASVYLRGIAYIQIPTSLLAMVDSSVGGKTAIDLPAGKNLVGAFYQPKLVLCDLDALNSLPAEVFRDGCAEVIKYGVLYDETLFQHLQKTGTGFDHSYVIPRCIELKRNVVSADEFDKGQRQKLNFGHTVGHAIEQQSGYRISHGKAVSAGMAIITKAAYKTGFCDEAVYKRVCSVLQLFGLPITTEYSALQLYTCTLSDKKRGGDTVNFILPKAIGNCMIAPIATDKIQSLIEAGL